MKPDRKQLWIEAAPTEVLERIINTLAGPEVLEPTPEYPLGGLVHMAGVGQIRVAAIRTELDRRKGRQ